jgi:hypothetical protein
MRDDGAREKKSTFRGHGRLREKWKGRHADWSECVTPRKGNCMSDRPNGRTRSQGNTKSKQFNKCSLQVRDLPLEAFRLPKDGRKWKQLARSRSDLLLKISTFANPDGTFISEDGKKNFSPSAKRLLRHYAEDTFYRLSGDLRELGMLFWQRNNHYGRRFYWIHIPGNHLRYSQENHLRYSGDQLRSSEVLSPPTSRDYPSLESLPSGVGSPHGSSGASAVCGVGSPPPLVSDEKQLREHGGARAPHHHQPCSNTPPKTAEDEDERSQNPEQVTHESSEMRVRRLKKSALVTVKKKFGDRFDDAEILEEFDRYAQLASRPPKFENFFVRAFHNFVSELEDHTPMRHEPEPKLEERANVIAQPSPDQIYEWQDLEFYRNPAPGHNPSSDDWLRARKRADIKVTCFVRHTREFRDPEKRREYADILDQTRAKKMVDDARRARAREQGRARTAARRAAASAEQAL